MTRPLSPLAPRWVLPPRPAFRGSGRRGGYLLVYVLVLGALTALGAFTIDLYLPAFPVIEGELDVSTAVVQLTLTATTLGFALVNRETGEILHAAPA